MRIPNNLFSERLTSQLQSLSSKQSKLQEQAATGQRITNPSDDPQAVTRVLQIQSEKQQVSQFHRNNQHATQISEVSFSALDQIKNVAVRSSELATLGNGITSPQAYQAYAAEANQQLEQALQLSNARSGGDYLLGGTKTDAPPVSATRDSAGKITAISYNGAATGAEFKIAEGGTISPFTTGTENQQVADFLNQLVSLRDGLQSANPTTIQALRPNIEASEDLLLNTLSGIGAKQTRLVAESSQNETRFSHLEKEIATATDADLAQVVVKLTQAQTAYQAALQSGAQILNTSLLDYLR